MAKNTCDVLLEILADAGVKFIFAIPGGAINTMFEAIRNQDRIKLIHVRHEEAGAFAASAISKLTGGLGVCLGTAGPGSIHLLNGLYDAKFDHASVLAISGQVETAKEGIDYHQDIDLYHLFSDVAIYNQIIDNPAQFPRIAEQACRIALNEAAVTHLILPGDIAKEEVNNPEARSKFVKLNSSLLPAQQDIDKAIALLNTSKKVAILAGKGAKNAANELLALAEKLHAPIIKPLAGKDIIPDEHPHCLGGIGLLGTKPAYHAMKNCDCLLMVGTDFPYESFYPEGGVPVVQIDNNAKQLGKRRPLEIGLLGDARETLAAINKNANRKDDSGFLEGLQKDMADWWYEMEETENEKTDPMHPQTVAAVVSRHAPDNTIFCCDTGNVTVWSARHLRIRGQQLFTLSGGLASMGYAFPAAIGAQLTFPDRQVIAMCGDGGFAMMMGDFLTAVQYELPIIAVVFNNHKLGMIQMEQEEMGYPEFETHLHNADYAAFAKACGGDGRKIRTQEELEAGIQEALLRKKPFVLDCEVNPGELTWPPHVTYHQAFGFAKAKIKEFLTGK
jgi:pyruvate oxidase